MKIDEHGWAEQEHAGESVPAAMHNAHRIQQLRAEHLDEQFPPHWMTNAKFPVKQLVAVTNWQDFMACLLGGYSIAAVTCCTCGLRLEHFGLHSNGRLWHRHAFTCGHEIKWECPACYDKPDPPFPSCSKCGCGEVWT